MASKRLTLKIERAAYGNLYIARHEGKVVMVKGLTMPGETVEVAIEKEKKDYITAFLVKVIEPSPSRIEPACVYYGKCGGCQYQHIPYKEQVKIKEDVLKDCLRRIAKNDTPLSESIISTDIWNYRLRGQFKVSEKKIGFFREHTWNVIDVESCPIINSNVNDHLARVRELLKMDHIKEVHITTGDKAVTLLNVEPDFPHNVDMNKLFLDFKKAGFPGLSIDTGKGMVLNFGEPYITLDLAGLKYSISPLSFVQSNWSMNLSIISLIKEELGPLKGKKVIDLYSGAGNFSLPLADEGIITAVEENPHAIDDGRRNLEINGINNYKFINSSAEEFRPDEKPDIIILDPPRPGLTNSVMENVLDIMPERLVYVSCNPTTFARDLKKLAARYNVQSIRMADLFPQTYHIETIAFFSLK